jgi:DNA topoisomerase-1
VWETEGSDGEASAESAGLVYASDLDPGFARRRWGRGFRYVAPSGAPVRDQRTLERIRSLAIPPAWTEVWIALDADAHLLATGRDARGRKQYLYHPRFREVRDAAKFHRVPAFGRVLPDVRERIEHDLRTRGLRREKVLSAVLLLIDTTLIRIGNERYRDLNESFGATTLRRDHAAVRGTAVRVSFRGKHGKQIAVRVADARFARIVRGCQELRGQDLFSYQDGDEVCDVRSDDVNDHLREISGDDFSVKDFRTWGASALALALLADVGPPRSQHDGEHMLALVTRIVARDLGNTPRICRRSYVHPDVIETYRAGAIPLAPLPASRRPRLHDAEAALMRLLGGQG